MAYRLPPLAPLSKETAYGLWPTPTVLGNNNRKGLSSKSGDGLATAIKRYPTPTVMDAAGFCGKPDKGRTGPNSGRTLTGRALEMEGMGPHAKMWPTPKASPSGPDYARVNRPDSGGDDLATAAARQSSGGQLNPTWVEWLMNWPLGWTSSDPLPKENFDDWQFRTQGGSEEIQGQVLRCMWWDEDPSEAPYRPQSNEQRAEEHSDTLSGLPQGGACEGGRLGPGNGPDGQLRDLRPAISTQETTARETLRKPGVPEREGQIIGRVAVGVKNRVDRLKALGNGQVPAVVRIAWLLLGGDR